MLKKLLNLFEEQSSGSGNSETGFKPETSFEQLVVDLRKNKIEFSGFLSEFINSDLHFMSKSKDVSGPCVIIGEDRKPEQKTFFEN